MLVGRDRNWEGGNELLSWMRNPGNASLLLPQNVIDAEFVYENTYQAHIDCVDAFLMTCAHEITEQCNFRPFISIATYDFGDFARCLQRFNLNFILINPDTLDQFP